MFSRRGDRDVGDRVRAAFAAVPRDGFLPAESRSRAAYDGPLPIGHRQTNSQPRTVADMLRLLDVRPGDRVLDVGAGSGWTTALLARLAGADGSVLGLELVPDLAEWGAANLDAWRARAGGAVAPVRLEAARPGLLGDPAGAPYDRILVSAEARRLPPSLVDQVGDGGRMVIPVHGMMTLVRRTDDEVSTSRHGGYRFVPLVE